MCNCEDRPCCGCHLEDPHLEEGDILGFDDFDRVEYPGKTLKRKRRRGDRARARQMEEFIDAFENGRF